MRIALLFLSLLFSLTACDSGVDESANVGGTWTGTVTIGTDLTATLVLQQTGSTVTGTASINDIADVATLRGDIDGDRFTWTAQVASGCIVLDGTTDVNDAGAALNGTVEVDASSCPQPTIVRGPIMLTRR